MSNRQEDLRKLEREMDYPKLRPIDALPISVGQSQLVMLKDPDTLTNKTIVVPPEAFFIISKFDGKHSIKDIIVEYNRKFGVLIFSDRINEVISELDAALLLENDRYRKYMEFLEAEFKKQDFREAKMSGSGYPDEPEELKKEIETFFEDLSPDEYPDEKPVGIVSPHIDFIRGNRTYGYAYRELKKTDADRFVIFGTSHRDIENYIALTKKTFKTPLGELPVDTEFVDEVANRCSCDFYTGEYTHKGEHSIEFQAVMLKYIFPDRNIKIIPVLVSSFDDFKKENKMPMEKKPVKEFIEAFRQAAGSLNNPPVFIAGVDFAHVGLSFGDTVPPSINRMNSLREDELESIKYIENMDADGFFKDVSAHQESRRVCGLAPLYVMMKCMEVRMDETVPFNRETPLPALNHSSYCGTAHRARLLEYRQCTDQMGFANVTVAAMGFY